MRATKKDEQPGASIPVPGEWVTGDLVRAFVALIPMAIDLCGKWGALMDRCMFDYGGKSPVNIPAQLPYHSSVSLNAFKLNHDHSHCLEGQPRASPTPKEHTIQRLGLAITKDQGRAYALHLRNPEQASKHPPQPTRPNPPDGRKRKSSQTNHRPIASISPRLLLCLIR